MNYIKRLEAEKTETEAQKTEAREAAEELRRYLLSDKFQCGSELDGYVSIKDVLNRLEAVINPLR
jgi:hypothetical protein